MKWKFELMVAIAILLPIVILQCSTSKGDDSVADSAPVIKPVSHSEAMAQLHNQFRAEAGLPAQATDERLSQVAQRWAEVMASRGVMQHGGGEQVIAYSGVDRSYNAGFRLWLNSPPHRSWLYSRVSRCGFGYAIGRNGNAYYAGAFGGDQTAGEEVCTSASCNASGSRSRSRFQPFGGFFRRR